MFKPRTLSPVFPRLFCLVFSLTTAIVGPHHAVFGADVTFIHVGTLPGDDSSQVHSVNNAVKLAACASFHIENQNPPRVFDYAARWTPSDGLQALPRLPNTSSAADPDGYFPSGEDVTSDGTRVAFTAPTTDQSAVAAGISDPDGGNLIALTSLPNGELMPAVSQLSDDGQTAFGFRRLDSYHEGAMWTAAGGIQALIPPSDYTNVSPASRAISADGSISALVEAYNVDYDP